MEVDQAKVAGHLAQYFSTIADGIGGDNVHSLTEEDYRNCVAEFENNALLLLQLFDYYLIDTNENRISRHV